MTYSDARDACDREGPNVHPWCDGDKGPVTCGTEAETLKPKRDIESAKSRIAELKERRDKANTNRSSAKTDDEKKKYDDENSQLDKDLYEAGKRSRLPRKRSKCARSSSATQSTRWTSASRTVERC